MTPCFYNMTPITLPRLYHSDIASRLRGITRVKTADEYRHLSNVIDVCHWNSKFGYFSAPDNKIYAMVSHVDVYSPRYPIKLYQLSTRAKDHLTLDDCYLQLDGNWGFYYKDRLLVDKSRHVIMASLVDPSHGPPWLVEFELTRLFCD